MQESSTFFKKYSINSGNLELALLNGWADGSAWKMSVTSQELNSSDFSILQKKSKLAGYVVASGLQYGMGENLFHYFFKVDINHINYNFTQYTVFLGVYYNYNLQYYRCLTGILDGKVSKSSCIWRGHK